MKPGDDLGRAGLRLSAGCLCPSVSLSASPLVDRAYLVAVTRVAGTTARLLIFHSCTPRRSTTRY